MTSRQGWWTDKMVLFLLGDGVEPTWLPQVGLQALTWSRRPTRFCEHCGGTVPLPRLFSREGDVHREGVCELCGETSKTEIYDVGSATAVLVAPMPLGDRILYLLRGATIDVTCRDCGRHDTYDEQEVILRLSGCDISKWWFSSVSPPFSDDVQALKLCVRVECNLTIRIPNPYCSEE